MLHNECFHWTLTRYFVREHEPPIGLVVKIDNIFFLTTETALNLLLIFST